MKKIMNAEKSYFFFHDKSSGLLWHPAKNMQIMYGTDGSDSTKGICALCCTEGEPRLSNDLKRDERWDAEDWVQEVFDRENFVARNCLTVPVFAAGYHANKMDADDKGHWGDGSTPKAAAVKSDDRGEIEDEDDDDADTTASEDAHGVVAVLQVYNKRSHGMATDGLDLGGEERDDEDRDRTGDFTEYDMRIMRNLSNFVGEAIKKLSVDMIFEQARQKLDDHQRNYVGEFFMSHVDTINEKLKKGHMKISVSPTHAHTVDSFNDYHRFTPATAAKHQKSMVAMRTRSGTGGLSNQSGGLLSAMSDPTGGKWDIAKGRRGHVMREKYKVMNEATRNESIMSSVIAAMKEEVEEHNQKSTDEKDAA